MTFVNPKIEEYAKLIEDTLYDWFAGASDAPLLIEAMRYSLQNGGKRVRPLLTLLFCDAAGGKAENALPFASAVEYIHTYSLIHDDLPCMDNDALRRGKPSNHVVYGEATALLAGDSLLTAAFEVLSSARGRCSDQAVSQAVMCLSRLAGARGMAGGQQLDLENEGKKADFDSLRLMDQLKTGALIEAACELGCLAAGADETMLKAAREFAENVGLAFQIQDDILDVTSSASKLGKNTGSDVLNDKSTYVSLLGVEKCSLLVGELTAKADAALGAFPACGALREYAAYLSGRDH